ncbi:Sel1 domain-containing protein [Pseudogulbenkiania sp. NH8B]|uniref:tetratricopeptide repeat protein n=1 Tax=Pseudogulbenkiania sp. (strain NH8B) TaxID=748280 RepID=UPI0002279B52|nr:tetratricopeptide repeat protein [Pseudogulbenkiania sp. NH8B]BAK76487.1 Sel1 domain-containing protein [Pseudogulbenkiania sp. NH8B]BAK76916.1 Sel1 domain-containing protein [Pseudogulbenkiania sp. NH8B]
MNDIDFALFISPRIGELYKSAKENSSELPDYSLGRLRGLCHLVCELIAEKGGLSSSDGGDLDQKIYRLFKEQLINSETMSKLHQLRKNGNTGAHPEKFYLTKQGFTALCEQSMNITRELLHVTYQLCHPGSPVPHYDISAQVSDGLKEICYQAMIGADPEARYMAGKIFKDKVDGLKLESQKALESGDISFHNFDIQSFREQAVFWFRLASANEEHAPSMFEYGAALANGFEGEDKIAIGENLICRASRLGNADAHAFIGCCYMFGSKLFDVDPVEARNHFELAAMEDHPTALINLGAMYDKGMGGPANPQAAFDYTRRAAEAGYPEGQYNLFVHYLNGIGVDKDEITALNWLTKAAEQGFPTAMFTLAKFIAEGRVEGKGSDDAESLYLGCLKSGQLGNEVLYELAQVYIAKGADYEDLIKAANLLQKCYEREGGKSELAQQCWKQSPPLVSQIRNGFARNAASDSIMESAIIVLSYFDSMGHPVKNRQEQNRKFLDNLYKFREARDLSEDKKIELAGQLFIPGMLFATPKSTVIPFARKSEKIGRNDRCPCGSGKKFKVCCGR